MRVEPSIPDRSHLTEHLTPLFIFFFFPLHCVRHFLLSHYREHTCLCAVFSPLFHPPNNLKLSLSLSLTNKLSHLHLNLSVSTSCSGQCVGHWKWCTNSRRVIVSDHVWWFNIEHQLLPLLPDSTWDQHLALHIFPLLYCSERGNGGIKVHMDSSLRHHQDNFNSSYFTTLLPHSLKLILAELT